MDHAWVAAYKCTVQRHHVEGICTSGLAPLVMGAGGGWVGGEQVGVVIQSWGDDQSDHTV
jgi:hypothetical protein